MALSKFYHVFGIDTAMLYTDKEKMLDNRIRYWRNKKTEYKNNIKSDTPAEEVQKIKTLMTKLEHQVQLAKSELKEELVKNEGVVRTLADDSISERNIVSVFDSSLSRSFGLKEEYVNREVIIIQVYYFEICKSIIKHGFYYKGDKYVFFSSSAGQIRQKKMVCVKESLLKKNWNRLTCGLSVEDINRHGGNNINKYLAYLALCNSATDEWVDFDINKCIVVNDFETDIECEVDYISSQDYSITRKTMPVAIPHTDGSGMMLPSVSKVNHMTRLPWIKGLLCVFDFIKFIKERGCSPIVKDIWGKEHDIIAEDIQIIFTKSQFKMYMHYDSWDQYKENFIKYQCMAGKCNIEVVTKETRKPTINYQMIQSLVDITDSELKALCQKSYDKILAIASNKSEMLKAFGAVEENPYKNGFLKSLMKYPELLGDVYCRGNLRDIKKSLEKDLWAAKFEVNGYYTFILPDLYAFCEHLFMGIEVPEGLLKNGDVHCKLFDFGKKVDCLRSPHLYQEHAVRNNISNDEIEKWFTTNALYAGTHDPISKILMYDVDGDTSLVIQDEVLVNVAERNMKGVVPLYYDMSKAKPSEINPDNLYKGLEAAFTGGNIGIYSNNISKIKNSENMINHGNKFDEALKCIKWLCLQNNETIDFAKTLYKSTAPDDVAEIIRSYTKSKLPYFFKFAKNKTDDQVEEINNSPVNRIFKLFPKLNLNFNFKHSNIGKFDYKTLMSNPDVDVDYSIYYKYRSLTKHKNRFITGYDMDDLDHKGNYSAILNYIKKEMNSLGFDEKYVCDCLIEVLFHEKNSRDKRFFWSIYGDVIYDNICNNISDNFIQCELCEKRFYKEMKDQCYCNKCQRKVDRNAKKGLTVRRCVDCNTIFMIPINAAIKVRCEECQKEYRKKTDRQRKRLSNSASAY